MAVIAPDVRWKAAVPGEKSRRDVAFDVPLPVRAPGIYVVTAAATDREASTVVLVSDLDLVARAVGPDLAVGVFRAGKPVAGAALMLRFGDTLIGIPVGGSVVSNLFVAEATFKTLTLTNHIAQTNVLTVNVKKEVEVPLK